MAKINRTTHKIFGASGSSTYFGEFGSAKAGTPVSTKDLATIMSLSAWDTGWQDALVATANGNAPCTEEENSVDFVHSTQIAYLFQEGTSEWDAGTTYWKNSIVKLPISLGGSAGAPQLFASIIDNNVGNQPPPGIDNSNWKYLNPPTITPASTVVGNCLKAGLAVNCASAIQVSVSASMLSVQGVVLETVSVTPAITTAGANGLDTGTEVTSTWYAVFVITNNDGTLVAGLLSTSAVPTLPILYTKYRRVGWVRNNSSGNFVYFFRTGDSIYYTDAAIIVTNPSGLTSFTNSIPPTSRLGLFIIRIYGGSGGSTTMAVPGTTMTPLYVSTHNNTGGLFMPQTVHFDFPTDTGQNITIVRSGQSIYLTIKGYSDPV